GTVLGSCVAVCLWDSQLRFGGMNHYLLPNRPANAEMSTRFGDVAIAQLIESMLGLGSHIRNLQAKLFGGGYVLRAGDPAFSAGRRNAEVAVAQLRRWRIPIAASRLSGTQGLVIRQCTDCGDVWVRPTGVMDKRLHPPADVDDLSCFSDDRFSSMVICGEDGQPVAIHTRSVIAAARGCNTCTSSPFGWRRT
ncbi:MAG: chemotaxis protein CheD, partial [Rhodospirillaceae bacterium]